MSTIIDDILLDDLLSVESLDKATGILRFARQCLGWFATNTECIGSWDTGADSKTSGNI